MSCKGRERGGRLGPVVSGLVAVLAVVLAAACTSLDYELLRPHVLATDHEGRVVDVESEEALEGCALRAHVGKLLTFAQEQVAQRGIPAERELLIHLHGGLNPANASLATAQAALRRMQADPSAPHAIFITWPSGAWSTWTDHLLRIRQGERWPRWLGYLTAPLILVTDVAKSIAVAPKTLFYQWYLDARVAGKVAFDVDLSQAMADEPLLVEAAAAAGYHLRRGSYRRGFLTQAGRFVTYWLSQPPKVFFQVFALNGLGQGAWEVMLHRTRALFHAPDEFDLSGPEAGDPRAAARQVEGRDGQRLRAFFDELYVRTCRDPTEADRCWNITLVGHSMGAIVLNEVLAAYPELPVRNLVYMAPACSLRDLEKVVVPYLEKHSDCRFFLLTLHPIAEADECYSVLPYYDLLPRGSLLEWIDNWYTTPPSMLDRVAGKWLNVVPALQIFKNVRARVYIKSFDVGNGAAPQKHGDFNSFDFWRPEFWWDARTAR
ncbi:MAG: hypothetical protein R3F56_02630 [Planctomycetota bacterium]